MAGNKPGSELRTKLMCDNITNRFLYRAEEQACLCETSSQDRKSFKRKAEEKSQGGEEKPRMAVKTEEGSWNP